MYTPDDYLFGVSPEVIALVPGWIARKHSVIPIRLEGDVLVVAVVTMDKDTPELLTFVMNRPVTVVRASPQAIEFALERYYPSDRLLG